MEPLKSSDPSHLGDWRIMGRLGEGGFGTVYLAERGAQKAAIKVIKQEFVEDSDARYRLATEAEVLSKLSDPFIGKILDSDVNGTLPWIATEFINGPTLDNKVKYEGPLDEIAWFNLAANIFHAIVTANELGVIHKDIKPSNIILGETGNKLIDFGIAHVSGRTKTAIFGDREGSTPFSSPEHFTPRANPKMDVFSAAATLAFAGKGSGVWIGENDLQLMRSINDDLPDLTGLTPNQVAFLIPLFEKNPSDRLPPETAQKLALDYIQFLLGGGKQPKITASKKKIIQPKFSNLLETQKTLSKGEKLKSKRIKLGVAAIVIGTAGFMLTKFFAAYFWTIVFLLLPVGLLWITIRTYRRGIGSNGWGKKSLLKSLLIFLTSIIVPIVLMLAMLFSAITIPFEIRQFFNQFSSQSQDATLPASNSDLSVKTVISIRTKDLNDAANNSYYRKDFIKSLESATESANLGNAEGMYLAGRAAQALGKFELALTWFQKGSASNFAQASLAGGIILINQEKNIQAENELRKAIDLGSIEAITALASFYLRIGQVEKASELFKTSIDQGDMNSTILYANLLSQTGKSAEALKYFLQASKAGESFGSIGAGLIYEKNPKTFKEAKKFYQLGIDQGLVEGHFYLGKILSAEGNFIAAKNSYLISADIDGGFSAVALATLFGEKIGDLNSACIWAQRVATLKDVDQSEKDAAQKLSLKYCPKATKTPQASSSKSSSNSVKASESPKASPKAIPSSDSFKVSAPLASNVQVDEIFGRAFKNSLKYWVIPLTVIKGAKVPEISAVQFRLIGYPDAGWLDVPYKLKTDAQFGTVQAVVDDILLAWIFMAQKYCPEFRFVREESGKIVRIWNKGQPDCATDYNP